MKKLGLLWMIMLGIAGCPGEKNKTAAPVPVVYNGVVGNCVNCGFNSAVFSQPVTAELPQGSLTLVLSGDSNQMNVWGSAGQNPLFSYQGPISVTGNLNVTSFLPFGVCQLPPGQYSLRTIQAGIYNMGTFEIPAVELAGPVRMVIGLTQGTILTNGNGQISSFGSLLIGLQGPAVMGAYGQPNLAQTNCLDSIGVRF